MTVVWRRAFGRAFCVWGGRENSEASPTRGLTGRKERDPVAGLAQILRRAKDALLRMTVVWRRAFGRAKEGTPQVTVNSDWLGAMNKKKTKKAATRRSANRHPAHKKQADPAQVREEIAGIVKSGAKGITAAVMDQALHGELAPAKYLFEVAGVYPPASDGTQATEEEDCLAKALLDRLEPPRQAAEPQENSKTEAGGKENEHLPEPEKEGKVEPNAVSVV
jgi:hypothetical protein